MEVKQIKFSWDSSWREVIEMLSPDDEGYVAVRYRTGDGMVITVVTEQDHFQLRTVPPTIPLANGQVARVGDVVKGVPLPPWKNPFRIKTITVDGVDCDWWQVDGAGWVPLKSIAFDEFAGASLMDASDIPDEMPLDSLIDPLRSQVEERRAKLAHEPVEGVTLWNGAAFEVVNAGAAVKVDGEWSKFINEHGDFNDSVGNPSCFIHPRRVRNPNHTDEILIKHRDEVRAQRAMAKADRRTWSEAELNAAIDARMKAVKS